MVTISASALRQVRSLEDLLEFLEEELDWPLAGLGLEEVSYAYTAAELGVDNESLGRLQSLRRLRPLSAEQPWGVVFAEFDGPRLPITPLRRLLQALVRKKRAGSGGDRQTWDLDDLLFFVSTGAGESLEIHLLAFFDADAPSIEIRSLPWRPRQSPDLHLERLAGELLPGLEWPADPSDTVAWRDEWRSAFKLRHGEAIGSAARLADRMAATAASLREQLIEAIEAEGGDGPFSSLLADVRRQLVADADPASFADMAAQTLVYGVLSSRITDPVGFGASPTLSAIPLSNDFLGAFFERVYDSTFELDLEASGLEQLVADLRETVNIEAVLDQFGSSVQGGDPVIHFYEEFLSAYDPQIRAEAGAFYTPRPVVECMVRLVDEVLKQRFGLRDGVADSAPWSEVCETLDISVPTGVDPAAPFVSMVDPATGTGTFLVEWFRRARASYQGEDWPQHAENSVAPSMCGLELMLAPYTIAHVKLALEAHAEGAPGAAAAIVLTDTLDDLGTEAKFEGMSDPMAVEGAKALSVKADRVATVCIGNPPYDRVTQDQAGGWIVNAPSGRSPFDDLLDVAREHTIFSHHASLYNLYVYFWRWAMWKVFERDGGGPGIAAFITASSWLTGPGFVGLRQMARELGDEIWIIDLGGDNKGAHPEENVFDIQTPVAIVVVVRRQGSADEAVVHYRRVRGSRVEKFAELDLLSLASEWAPVEWPTPRDPLVPNAASAEWSAMPLVTDLFPWQQPGCKFGRTWPIAPSSGVLDERWRSLLEVDDAERAERFVTPSSGRNIESRVSGYDRIVDLEADAESEPVVRYGYRSFDRQWAFADPRMAKTESPSLWATQGGKQVFLVTKPTFQLGTGPAAVASANVPDLHFFRGSYGGKDVIPLFRDRDGTPNIDPALLGDCATRLGRGALSHEDLFAYVFGVLAGTDYTERFSVDLETPGPRVPLTSDPALFDSMAELGRRLIWLHTFGERFDGSLGGFGEVVDSSSAVWRQMPSAPPPRASAIGYDPSACEIHVGDGIVAGVAPEVWGYEVSGMQVLKKWLGYRCLEAAGRAGSSGSLLDSIRASEWDEQWSAELLEVCAVIERCIEESETGIGLLDEILEGDLVAADDFPLPPDSLRKPPKVQRRRVGEHLRFEEG